MSINYGPATQSSCDGLVLRNRSGLEQIREIAGVDCIAEERLYAKDLLHGAQIGGVCVQHRARIRHPIHVLMRMLRNDDLGNGVAEIVSIVVSHAIALRFVPPKDDDSVV